MRFLFLLLMPHCLWAQLVFLNEDVEKIDLQTGKIWVTDQYFQSQLYFFDTTYQISYQSDKIIIHPDIKLYNGDIPNKPQGIPQFNSYINLIEYSSKHLKDPWDKVYYVMDWIGNNFKYKEDKLLNAELLLSRGYGDCAAYSVITRYLFKRLGIESVLVGGVYYGNSVEFHQWNMVKINDSEWYPIDPQRSKVLPINEWNELYRAKYDIFK